MQHTTNLNLNLPEYNEAADIQVINGNMNTIDTAITAANTNITATKSDLGIVEDGNTATHSITAGQYVIWKGNLYTAKSAIATGTTLSTSNLTAVSNGGLNSLNEQLTSNITQGNDAYSFNQMIRLGKLRIFHYVRKIEVPNNTVVTTLEANDRPQSNVNTYSWYKQVSGYGVVLLSVGADGKVALGAISFNEGVAGDFIIAWTVA